MRSDVVTPTAGDGHDRCLERGILERLDLSAVVADEVMVMISSRVGALEARDPVPEVDPLHETELVEAVERAVDARDPDLRAPGAHAVVDLLRREAAVLAPEEFDDEATSAAAPAAHVAQA